MDAIFLVGGLGTRLYPLTKFMPKTLIPIGGCPVVNFMLRKVEGNVNRKILIAGGDPKPWLRYSEYDKMGTEIQLVIEERPFGTGGALKILWNDLDFPIIVVNGDLILNININDMINYYKIERRKGFKSAMNVIKVKDKSPYGSPIIIDGRVVDFIEKNSNGSGWINGGIYIFEKEIINYFPSGIVVSLENDVLPPLAQENLLTSYPVNGRFSDAGTLKGLIEGQRIVMDDVNWQYKNRNVKLPNVEVIDPVFISEDVEIEDGCRIGPYATIMDKVKIGRGSIIEDSVILNSVEVEEDVKLKGVILSSGGHINKGRKLKWRIL